MRLHTLSVACTTAVTALILAGCDGGSVISPAINLSGIASTGAPLVGIVVTATDPNGNVIQSTTTDANGTYSMQLRGYGPYVLTAPFNDIDGTPALLTSVFAPYDKFGGATQANINPLTSMITSRVVGMIPTSPLSGAQIKNANITPTSIANAEHAIFELFAPIYTALQIPTNETVDPIGTTFYHADPTDPLDNFFTLARFNVHLGQVAVGTDSHRVVISVPATGALASNIPSTALNSVVALNASPTTTPITNVIVVVGENQTFDTIFGTYVAPQGQSVKNLLSQGIVNADGTPGANFSLSAQNQAEVQTTFSITPKRTTPYAFLPQPTQIGELPFPFQSPFFLGGTPDPAFPSNLPNGSFQLTSYVPYDIPPSNPVGTTTGNPVHRFFQMWQQTGGTNAKLDMYTWVAVTAGQGGGTPGITSSNPGQGGELMAFLNMSTGDAPYLKSLAQQYAMSDNYHQSILGGTGANFYAIATADVPYFNTNGVAGVPFSNQIENPNPTPGTPNFYIQDGYGDTSGSLLIGAGSYVNCSDTSQPGVAPILTLLSSLSINSKCDPGKYYLVNNYGWGYDMNGIVQPIGPENYNTPPQTVPTIAEALAKKGVSWKWYAGARQSDDVAAEAALLGAYLGLSGPAAVAAVQALEYNNTGDPLVASKNVMTTPSLRAGLSGLTGFFNDVQNNTLPAVSFVVPTNLESGHPGYSVAQKYELFVQNLISQVKANPALWAHTAIIITTDEGGGYFDTGPIQVQDFFGDGPRIPFLVVSPYARANYIDHTYHDHASILKFIERNWRLAPLSARSRDNHPNPVTTSTSQYLPTNGAALGDLTTMFAF